MIAEFITNPIVIPILITIGCLGLVVELFTPRFGLPGIIGLSAFLLFFYGHLVTGIAEINSLILFASRNRTYFIRVSITRGNYWYHRVWCIPSKLFPCGREFCSYRNLLTYRIYDFDFGMYDHDKGV